MSTVAKSRIPDLIRSQERELLYEWTQHQVATFASRRERISQDELTEHSKRFIALLQTSMQRDGGALDLDAPAWSEMRDLLAELSRTRARAGFSPGETAAFIFSFKQPLFTILRQAYGTDAEGLADDVWVATLLLDRLGVYTIEMYQRSREEVILRQQEEMMELSTPVVQLWDGVLALPLIGTLDSARTQVVMENLLQKIVETGAEIAIIDITGVPTVDTLVAQHLLKTVSAARLMGAECIISGIRPQIAQTIVHLGVELHGILTKSTLADAFKVALDRNHLAVQSVGTTPAA
jgi:rsbT co-antagonist protein RsbR